MCAWPRELQGTRSGRELTYALGSLRLFHVSVCLSVLVSGVGGLPHPTALSFPGLGPPCTNAFLKGDFDRESGHAPRLPDVHVGFDPTQEYLECVGHSWLPSVTSVVSTPSGSSTASDLANREVAGIPELSLLLLGDGSYWRPKGMKGPLLLRLLLQSPWVSSFSPEKSSLAIVSLTPSLPWPPFWAGGIFSS